MSTRIIRIEGAAPHIHVAVPIEEIGSVRHNGIRANKLPNVVIIVPRIVIMQTRHIVLLAGELAVRGQGVAAGAGGAAARFAVGAVGLADLPLPPLLTLDVVGCVEISAGTGTG